MYRRLMVASAALMVAGMSTAAQAQDQWVLLGSKSVSATAEQDKIDLTAAKGNYKALRVVAKQRGIEINAVTVQYGDGKKHDEKRAINLLQGERTRAIDPGSDRFVDGITVNYKPQPAGPAPVLEVYGLQSPNGAKAVRAAAGGSGGGAASTVAGAAGAAASGAGAAASGAAGAAAKAAGAVAAAPAAAGAAVSGAAKAAGAAVVGAGAAAASAAGSAAAKAAPAPTAAVSGSVPGTPTKSEPTKQAVGKPTETGQVLFGSATVGFGVDRDVIKVGADVGKFDRIRMRVLDNDIFINSMKVVYANGESEEVAYNADVRKDTLTKWIPLKGDRFIKEVQMNYKSRPGFSGRAFVEVYGEYAEGWLGPQGEGKKFNSGWVLLGGQTAGYTIDRNDIIPVGKNEGGFRKIRLNVQDESVTLFEVRVIYGNGEVDIIPANRTKVDAGGVYGPIDLKGGTRIITEIRPTYRTRVGGQGLKAAVTGNLRRATVQFWGQH